MKVTRRLFLQSGGLALASVGVAPVLGPRWLRASAFGATNKKRKVLICLFQRGAVDGLSMVVPHSDESYYKLRSTNGGIAVPRTGADSVLDLDGHFGLHPALRAFLPIYKAGHLAPLHAVGSPDASRSHFDAQDYMELATPGRKSASDGWLARALAACPEDSARRATTAAQAATPPASLVRAVALSNAMPLSLRGAAHTLAFSDLKTFGIGGGNASAMGGASGGFEGLYENAVGDVLHAPANENNSGDGLQSAGRESFEALKMLSALKAQRYVPARGAVYPRGRWGESLKQIAQLVKADIGLQIAFADSGGWDTHAAQGGARGQLSRRLQEWSEGVAALYTDLGDQMDDVVILAMSEFGRTARQNGTGGTDHGHGTCFFALGGQVNGGRVLGAWPGLAPEQLHENRDLQITTDFRDAFAEVSTRHLGARDLKPVFPGFASSPKNYRGLLRM